MLKRFASLLVALVMLTTLIPAALAQQDTGVQAEPQVVEQVVVPDDTGDTENTGDTGNADNMANAPDNQDNLDNVSNAPDNSGDADNAGSAPDSPGDTVGIDDPADPSALLPTLQEAEQIAATSAAIAALPQEITWEAFAAVDAAGALYAAIPAPLQAQVTNTAKLTAAVDALLQIYADALAAIDLADIWASQHQIKAFAEMKEQMDAALYVKAENSSQATDGDLALMGDPLQATADLSWLDAALLAYADAEATIIPAGGDAELTDTHKPTSYQTLQKALGEVAQDDTILINKNITITNDAALLAGNDVTYTINTNKKTITFAPTMTLESCFDLQTGVVTLSGGGTLVGDLGGTSKLMLISGDATVTINNVTLTVRTGAQSSSALHVQSTNKATILNSTLAGSTGVSVYGGGSAEITRSTILGQRTGDTGASRACVIVGDSGSLTLNTVTLEAEDVPNVVVFSTGEAPVAVEMRSSTTLTCTTADGRPIAFEADAGAAFGKNVSVTLANTVTSRPLADGTYTLDNDQILFDTIAGGSVVADTLSNALSMADIALRENYASTDMVFPIPVNKTLDMRTYTLQAGNVIVQGTLRTAEGNLPQGGIRVMDTGSLIMGDRTYIAPKVADGAANKPVFGVHNGGEMHVHKDGDALVFTALSGEITIQSGFDSANMFAPNESFRFDINSDASVWLSNDVALYTPIEGINYIVATDASGKKNYKTLAEAVEGSTSVKLVRDLTGGIALDSEIIIERSTTIDLGGHLLSSAQTAFYIKPSKKSTVVIKNGIIDAGTANALSVGGWKNNVTSLTLEGVDIYSTIMVDEYAKLAIKNCYVSGVDAALSTYSSEGATSEVTVTNSSLNANSSNGVAVMLHGIQKLTMTDTYVHAQGTGMALMGGTVTLQNVTVSAGDNADTQADYVQSFTGGEAIVAVLNEPEGNALRLTLNGGSYTSQNGPALTFGYAGGVMPTQRTLAVTINGSTFTRVNGPLDALNKLGEGTAPAVVSEMVASPSAMAGGTYTLAKGAYAFGTANGEKSGLIVCGTLSAALGKLVSGDTLYLAQGYQNTKEEIRVAQGTTLQLAMGSGSLNVKSLTVLGQINAVEGSIAATAIEVNKRSETANVELKLASVSQLGNAMAQVVPYYATNSGKTTYHGKITIGNVTYVGASGDNAVLTLTGDARVGVRQKNGQVELVVISGTVEINDSPFVNAGVFDMGQDYLTIMPGARASIVAGITLAEGQTQIEGDIVHADIQAFLDALAELPPLDELDYSDYWDVDDVVDMAEALSDEVKQLPDMQQALAKLAEYEADYHHAYIRTSPSLFQVVSDRNVTVEMGGGISGGFNTNSSFYNAIRNVLEAEYERKIVFMEPTTSFELTKDYYNRDAVKTTDLAQTNDSVLANYRYVRVKGTPVYESLPNYITFRAIPTAISTDELASIMMSQYNHTVNLQRKSQVINMDVLYTMGNGMTGEYLPNQYDFQEVILEGTGDYPLNEAFTMTYDQYDVKLSPVEGALVKDTTYTGKIVYKLRAYSPSRTLTIETAPITVQAVDQKPDVKISFEAIDLFNTKRYDGENGEFYEVTGYGISLTGEDAGEVEGIQYDDVDGIKLWSDSLNEVTLSSDVRLTKRTIKPVITLTFSGDGGYIDQTYANTKGQGITAIKLTQSSPAIKLSKTALNISGNVGAEIVVPVLPTNKKNPYYTYDVYDVEVLETIGGKLVTSERVYAGLSYPNSSYACAVVLEVGKPIEKSTKFTLRFSFYDTSTTKDLPITLNVKDPTVKLGKSTAEMNIRSAQSSVDVPLTISTAGDRATLAAVNGIEAVDGEVMVDNLYFTCDDDDELNVASGGTRLIMGKKAYSLTFTGVKKAVTLTVSVVDKVQTVKLGKTSVTLNSTIKDRVRVPIVYSDGVLTRDQFELEHTSGVRVSYSSTSGNLTVRLTPNAQKTETIYVNVKDAETDPKKSRLKLTVKRNDKPFTMSVKMTSKLSTLSDDERAYFTVTIKGSSANYTAADILDECGYRDYRLSGYGVLSYDGNDVRSDRGFFLSWRRGANDTYGAGKYSATLRLSDSDVGISISSAPFTVVAEEPKISATAETATLHIAAPAQAATIALTLSENADIADVQLATASDVYTVERIKDNSFLIRYKTATPFDGTAWKATDSVKLNVTIAGIKKPISVTLPITNIKAQEVVTE